MMKLFYPTLDLFIYDLKSPLNATETEIKANTQAFCSRIIPNTNLNKEEPDTPYQELINSENKTVKFTHPNQNLQGYYYPVLLNDTYGLQIDLSVNNQTEAQSILQFKSLKEEIEKSAYLTPLTIGKTWLISGWLTEKKQNNELVAQQCFETLFNQVKWKNALWGKGEFLNSSMFELWIPGSYSNHIHALIILFPNRETAEKIAIFYKHWMGLFCYRHKIIWSYYQSRIIKNLLKKHYQKISEFATNIQASRNFSISLEQLKNSFQEIQPILDEYNRNLLNLELQKEAIETNLDNYQIRLDFIKNDAEEDQQNNLALFDKFRDLTKQKYLQQIDKDEASMKLGLQLIESNINALRSQIELEKSERERNFQTLATIVATGIAAVQLVDFENKQETCKNFFESIQIKSDYCNIFGVSDTVAIAKPFLLVLILGLFFLIFTQAVQKIWIFYLKIKKKR